MYKQLDPYCRRNNHHPSSSSPSPSPTTTTISSSLPPHLRLPASSLPPHLRLAASSLPPHLRLAAVQRKKMDHVRIFCYADIEALQHRSDRGMLVELVSLESLRIASDSCALLVKLIEERKRQCPVDLFKLRYLQCRQMDILSLVAGVALELHKIKHVLYPLVFQEAKLDWGYLKNLLLLKNSGVKLVLLAKNAKKIIEGCEDMLIWRTLGKVKEVGKAIEKTTDLVLKGTHDIAWLQARLPFVLDPVDSLLSTPVQFPE